MKKSGFATWNPDTGARHGPPVNQKRGEKNVMFTRAALSRNGTYLATYDGQVKLWDVPALVKELKPIEDD